MQQFSTMLGLSHTLILLMLAVSPVLLGMLLLLEILLLLLLLWMLLLYGMGDPSCKANWKRSLTALGFRLQKSCLWRGARLML